MSVSKPFPDSKKPKVLSTSTSHGAIKKTVTSAYTPKGVPRLGKGISVVGNEGKRTAEGEKREEKKEKTGLRLSFSLTATCVNSPVMSPRASDLPSSTRSKALAPFSFTLKGSPRSDLHSPRNPTIPKPPEVQIDLSEASPDQPEVVYPITPAQALKMHSSHLSEYERGELLSYPHIYYLGLSGANRRLEPSALNMGFDDSHGDYIVVAGDHIQYRYELQSLLGKGSFGVVVRAVDHRNKEIVAVKIIRNKRRFHQQGAIEVKVLQLLSHRDPEDRMGIVRLKASFLFRHHLCLVFELLSLSLYDCLRNGGFTGLSLNLIRRIAIQLIVTMRYVKANRVIHCDLKPENVLLKHANKSGVKVIDFGSACFETERVYTYIQSRFYRAPEVILGIPYSASIDMWSLGCLLAELHTGTPLFPGDSEQDQLQCMMEVLGVPPEEVLVKSARRKLFFEENGPKMVANKKGKKRVPGSLRLEEVIRSHDPSFTDFLSQCLSWDSTSRLAPDCALQHPWVLSGIAQLQQAVSPV